MMLKIGFIILAMFALSVTAGAETIHLKNGQVIKAKITKDTGYSIQIMEKGFPKTFYMEEVEKIDPDPDQQPAGSAASPEAYRIAGEKEALTEEKRDLIFRLMEANGARESMNQIFSQIINQAPAEVKGKYQELFKVDEIISRLAPIYAKYYTLRDLKELISFYKSPLGQKHISVTPAVMEETLRETVKYFQAKMPPEDKKPAAK